MKRFSTLFVLILATLLGVTQSYAKGGDADVSGPFVAQSAIALNKAAPADIAGQWTPLTVLPQGMGYNTAEFYNGVLYNFSGLNSATITQCYKLDLTGNAWTPTVTLPQPRLLASAHLVGDKIYIIGGYSSANPFTTHGQVLEYDPASNVLTPLSAMSTPVYAAGSFVKEGRIWVLGGGTTSFQAQSDAIQIYDPSVDRWTTSNSRLPLALRSFQAEVIGDDVYLVGGYQYSSQGVYFAHVYKGVIAGDEITWTKLADFPGGALMRQSMGTDGVKLYMAAGFTSVTGQTGLPSNATWSFDPATATWTSEAMKITPVYYASRMLYDGVGKYFVVGGVGASVYETAVEEYDAAAASKPIAVISSTSLDRWVKRANTYKYAFALGNIGGAPLDWSTAVSGTAWLTVDAPSSGTIQSGGQSLVTFTVNPNALSEGQYSGDITITTNDADKPQLTFTMSITVQEADVDEPANVLVEQYTGTWCQWCPYGADSLAAVSTRNGSRMVRMSWHDTDPMELAVWDAMNTWIGVTGFPTASINRVQWPGASGIPISRTDWGARTEYLIRNSGAPVGITISNKTYDPSTKTFSFKAKVRFHQGINADVRLNASVTEDGFDYAQKRINTATGVVETISPYIHKAVMMGIWPDIRGYQLSLGNSFASQVEIEQVFTFTSPHVNGDNAHLNVFVHQLNNGSPGPVLQATTEPLFFGLTTAVDDVPVLSSFALRQNYPNPFNPTTNVTFDVPTSSHVRITLHDGLGRMLGNLVDELSEAGSHTFTFDGANLQSGTYYLTMTAGDFVQTRSMTLVK
ncbi:MAG: Omp28-related outer membrane protein [Bacteroidetes bacterium]|nr:Omp28-related outer membrane protein [Bacteroidota bacterium]